MVEKMLVDKYLRGLRPDSLKIEVRKEMPETLDDAKRIARQQIEKLRIIKNSAHYFNGKDNDRRGGDHRINGHNRRNGDNTERKEEMKESVKQNEGQRQHYNGNNGEKFKKDYSNFKCDVCGKKDTLSIHVLIEK